MRRATLSLLFSFAILFTYSQSATVKDINRSTPFNHALAPLRFLASDELMGRGTTRPEIHIAARYISEQFRSFGLKETPGTQDYFQVFHLPFISAPTSGSFVAGNKTYTIGKDFVQARGFASEIDAPVVFANFGSDADLTNIDVKGKIVVVNMGENNSSPVMTMRRFMDAKQKRLKELGALALVERYWHTAEDWELPRQNFRAQRPQNPLDSSLPVFIVHDPAGELPDAVKNAATASIKVSGNHPFNLGAKNVIGWVEGTDPKLKNQFIVLTAHYDHIGVSPTPKMEERKSDSIYNGARDNAIGVTGMIDAAGYFSQHPAKRSILFIAFTAEEMGMLGSKYYAANPTIALDKIVYNLNIDNGGYNDTGRVNVIGLGRTSADADLKKATAAYGLTLAGDPAPEQGLFDRSDNVSFAAKGIPAPSYGMGVAKLDANIMKRYHQLSDEIGDIDMNYILKYIRSYILAAKLIADNPVQPTWTAGDKYEDAWKQLFSK
ncbi:M28 family peptidase [Pollutibacter soli]|uniref:M28 family peptidase n=1 Tax=Pollutibacter soli TaxID=3034157 RepID=UPI0030136668